MYYTSVHKTYHIVEKISIASNSPIKESQTRFKNF